MLLSGSEWPCQQKGEGNEWDFVCSISCLWCPRQTLTPCYGISFCVSSADFVLLSQPDSSSSKATEQHSSSVVLLLWCSRLSAAASYCSSFPCWSQTQEKEEESWASMWWICQTSSTQKQSSETSMTGDLFPWTVARLYKSHLWVGPLSHKARVKWDSTTPKKSHSDTSVHLWYMRPHKSLTQSVTWTFDVKIELPLELWWYRFVA